jgi:lysyl-tRNA synthetase class 1
MAEERFWIEQTADAVEAYADAKANPPEVIVCASGVSPSGSIHLGNMREVMTVHLVVEELLRRGRKAEHIHSWDDYDRFRKVPAGVPESFEQYIGMPLASVPDPAGTFPSYAERHISDFERDAARLGIISEKNIRYVRQSVAYPRGDYREGIITAMNHRGEIFDELVKYQNANNTHEMTLEERRAAYYPFKPYCAQCNKDNTTVTSWETSTNTLSYKCTCGFTETYSLNDRIGGKLVWKADWPMRWAYENVTFEPAGEDHASPGSSYTVGKEIVKIFNHEAPYFIPYTFVGMAGRSKISSSAGGSPTPAQALDILEPAMLRWLYIRRHHTKRFDVDFGIEVIRLYDEWDGFATKTAGAEANDAERLVRARCVRTSAGDVAYSKVAVPFRTLSSAADITQGNREQIMRIAIEQQGNEGLSETDIEPRLSCAINWATHYLPEDERTHVRESFDEETYNSLDEIQKAQISKLVAGIDNDWSLDGITTLAYAIPKEAVGLAPDADPTPEVKAAQRAFFIAIYRLMLVDSETGPRLPTFFLSLGRERVEKLLGR